MTSCDSLHHFKHLLIICQTRLISESIFERFMQGIQFSKNNIFIELLKVKMISSF